MQRTADVDQHSQMICDTVSIVALSDQAVASRAPEVAKGLSSSMPADR
jgi:hypothetical protein